MRRTLLAAALLLAAAAPAAAQFVGPVPVVDHVHILQDASHWAADLAKVENQITLAKQELAKLGPLANATTIAARLDPVNAALSKAQAAIDSSGCVVKGTAPMPAACAPVASILRQQMSQISAERQQITVLQAAPDGAAGQTAAIQALGKISNEISLQLVQMRQMMLSKDQAAEVRMQNADKALHSNGTMTLFGSSPAASSQ